jgi:hypothetical protein
MRPNIKIRLLKKKHMPSALLALSLIIGFSVYIELLGWRILAPDFSLSQAWNKAFVFGAIRTMAGAALFGIVPILLGAIPRRTRLWSISNPVLLWTIGAGVFLLAMAALVAWAP